MVLLASILNRDGDRCVPHNHVQPPIFSSFSIEGAHVHKQYHTHTHAQKAAGLLLRYPPCQSGPAVRWHPSPWRQLIASPDGNCAVKATISPSFHLLTPAIAIAAFSFVLRAPLCPQPSSFHFPIAPFLFIQNPKSEGKKKTDRSCVLH